MLRFFGEVLYYLACINCVVIHSVSLINWVVCKLDNLGTGHGTCLTQILFMELNIRPSEYPVKLFCGTGQRGGGGGCVIHYETDLRLNML